MKISIEKQKEESRTYLIVDGKKLKMLPFEFHSLDPKTVFSCIEDVKKKTLTTNERGALHVIAFLKEIENNEKYVYELIKDSKPSTALLVNIKNQEDPRYEIRFENGRRLKCSRDLFMAFEPKDVIFSNY